MASENMNQRDEEIDENDLPLSEFIKLPTTVDFQTTYTDRFINFIKDKPYIRVGTVFDNDYMVGYINLNNLRQLSMDLGSDFSSFYPKILSPLSSQANEISGITQVLNQPFLNLSGNGVMIGIIDTGIDYTKDAFKFEDGRTKILNIWDQSLDGARTEGIHFGSNYSAEQINSALQTTNPHSLVPTIDEDGHGTFLASVAASNEAGAYIGAAPKASLVVVKLRRARQYFIDRYLLSPDNPNLYESTDFMLGIKYVIDQSQIHNMPVVINIGMGSNSSAHDGNTLFEDYISFYAQRSGFAFVAAAGNESNAKHHTQGKIPYDNAVESISIKVGQQGASFSSLIFGPAFDKISIGIISPTGEAIPRVPFKSGLEYTEKLILENTTVYIKYYKDINNTVIIGLQNATEGIWDIRLFGDAVVSGEYWAWLPITGQICEAIEYIKPVPEYTIVYPASAMRAITCGAYNSEDNSLFVSSSWGPTRMPRMAPDLVAPGVNIAGIYPTGRGTMTGTSVAGAITAGAAALLLEWGIVQRNMVSIDGDLVRSLLISGCTRDENQSYPNIKWGYGKLNLYGSFTTIKETIINYSPNTSNSSLGGFFNYE